MGAGAMTQEKFYTVKEVAGILRVIPRTVRNMIADGELEAVRVRDEYRISESMLERYFTKQARGKPEEK